MLTSHLSYPFNTLLTERLFVLSHKIEGQGRPKGQEKRDSLKNKYMQNTHTPTVAELIALLDPATLKVLTARLHRVAENEGEPPEQMLLSFIDESLSAHEEVEQHGMDRVEMAEAILEAIPQLP